MIGPSTGFIAKAGNLAYVDISATVNPLGAKAIPGNRYRFPEIERVGELRGIVFHAREYDFSPIYDDRPVIDLFDVKMWTFTLRQMDGSYVVKDAPLWLFMGGTFDTPEKRKCIYFQPGVILDPLQSFFTTYSANANQRLIPFTLLY